jgi:cobalt-zinc-cadmium efflux system protein
MSHTHTIKDMNRSFAVAIALNMAFVFIEAIYGVLSGSLALLADAGHNLSDVLSLLMAWGASILAKKPSTEKRTYGYRKITIIASMVSAVLLLLVLGGIVWEAIGRLQQPQPVASITVIVVALIGVVINAMTALLFIAEQHHDLNIRAAFLHMLADAGISLGVAVAGLIIMQTDWLWIDPIMSMVIVGIILLGTTGLLRDSFNLSIDAVPSNIDIAKIKEYLIQQKGVCHIQDLHIWALSTTETALSVHLVVSNEYIDNRFLADIQQVLHQQYAIQHTTIQLEKEGECNLIHDPHCQ